MHNVRHCLMTSITFSVISYVLYIYIYVKLNTVLDNDILNNLSVLHISVQNEDTILSAAYKILIKTLYGLSVLYKINNNFPSPALHEQ